MQHRPAWFTRSLPQDWHGGRIRVDGDREYDLAAILLSAFIVAVIAVAIAGFFSG